MHSIHKNTKLLPYQRREAYRRWLSGEKVVSIAKHYQVSRKTLYEVFKKAKLGFFENYSSKNMRYRTLEYGLKRLEKTITQKAKKLTKQKRRLTRYEKEYPGEMVHTDSSILPLLRGEAMTTPREYLYVFVDDCPRTLFADILPDQTSWSAAIVLDEALTMLPFTVEKIYSDNGKEFKGAFKKLCQNKGIPQGFTKPYHPQTNGKAERVIKTIKTELLKGHSHISREERRRHLYAFVRYYNHVRKHQSLDNISPFSFLENYLKTSKSQSFPQECVTNA